VRGDQGGRQEGRGEEGAGHRGVWRLGGEVERGWSGEQVCFLARARCGLDAFVLQVDGALWRWSRMRLIWFVREREGGVCLWKRCAEKGEGAPLQRVQGAACPFFSSLLHATAPTKPHPALPGPKPIWMQCQLAETPGSVADARLDRKVLSATSSFCSPRRRGARARERGSRWAGGAAGGGGVRRKSQWGSSPPPPPQAHRLSSPLL
jgi:hypothetical protein